VRVTSGSLENPPEDPDGAPLAVAVGRTVGGVVMVIVGLLLALGGAVVFFVAPLVAPFTDDRLWNLLWDLDFVGAIVGGLGLALAFIGGGLVQRARRRKMQMLIDPSQIAGALREAAEDGAVPRETRTGTAPPTIL
jgi:hypothetical protein